MNKYAFIFFGTAALLFSCTRESVVNDIQPGKTITFTANWGESDATKTVLQSDGTSVWWDAAEQINVFFSDIASGKFTSTNSKPQAIVDFQGSLPIVVGSIESDNPAHAYWAVYPYNAANTCDGESVTLTVHSIQTAQEGTFANKMFPSIATSTNFHLAFYNICGGARFSVANEGITSITFKANNRESLVGKVQVGFDGVPVIKKVSEGVSEVTVNAPEGGFIPGKYYFVSILPQTLSKGVSLTFKKSDGKVASTSLSQSITINRSRFGKMDEKDKGLEFVDDGSGHNPNDIVFADSKVKEKLVAAFDTNGDGELSYEEAAVATSIEGVFGTTKTYKSFDEFQYFIGVTAIPSSMFEGWQISSIIIPESVKTVGDYSFKDCVFLTSADIPSSVTSLGQGVFYGCDRLSSISINGSVQKIEYNTFFNCSRLTIVSIPDSVTSIGNNAFWNCSSLRSIALPGSVTSIESGAFSCCSNLTNIIIPNNVTSIGNGAFSECCSLTSILIPDSVTSIGSGAFSYCNNLSSISLPESMMRIGSGAFSECCSLTSIIFPRDIYRIEAGTFDGCTNLTSAYIPESVTIIDPDAFRSCSSLINISIPNSVTKIGETAFAGCSSLTSITIPESVTSIERRAFYNCSNLSRIFVLPATPPQGDELMFDNTNNTPIFVLDTSVEAYKSAQYWSDYADRIQAILE